MNYRAQTATIWITLCVLLISGCATAEVEEPAVTVVTPPATPTLGPATATADGQPVVTPTPTAILMATRPTIQFKPQIQTPVPAMPAPVAPDPGKDSVERATDDLAQRLRVAAAAVEVVSVTTDEYAWGDLLCPGSKEADKPIPAFVVGQEIVLAAGEREYFYRARGRTLVFCGER